MTNTPLISIITATYNRSNILRYTIQTVIDQTFDNWELLVIGDGCTDDTADVVASFNNPKITFINLEKNVGEQSIANNHGMQVAKGSYVAFLNHDDLWLPQHLDNLLRKIEETNSDLVYSLYYALPITGQKSYMPIRPRDKHRIYDVSPASAWLFKKELYLTVGPWKFYKQLYEIPSQEWLSRVARRGKKISIVNEVTMVAVQSGRRMGSYKNRDYSDNERAYTFVKNNPDKLLKDAYFEHLIFMSKRDQSNVYHAKAIFRNIVFKILSFFGLKYVLLKRVINYPKRGAIINQLRENRGLTKI